MFDLDFGAPSRGDGKEEDALGVQPSLASEENSPQQEVIPPPPPTFSEEELELVREQAFKAGHEAGLQEVEAASAQALAAAMSGIEEQMCSLASVQATANEEILSDAVEVSLAVVRKLLPEQTRRHALDEIEGVIRECLEQLDHGIRVTVRVNPAHLDEIRDKIEEIVQAVAFEGKITCTADPRLAEGDCRVEWGDGGAERDQKRLWDEIDAILARGMNGGASAEASPDNLKE